MKRIRGRRFGFTLVEVAIAAAIVAGLAAVTAPSLMYFVDGQRAKTTADQLAAVAAGIQAFGSTVRTAAAATSTTYPGFVSELTSQIPLNSATWHNSCSGTFNATATAAWRSNGPYLSFYVVPTSGIRTPLGMIQDALVRTPASATAGTLGIVIPAVDTAAASLLDRYVDGTVDGAAGTLRLGTPTAGSVSVTYLVPIKAQC